MTKSKILLIEDEDLVGTMVQMNLEEDGHLVRWERRGDEGLRVATEEPFDLYLLDISLPGIDGVQILTRIRELGIGTPVLMLTARGDVESKVRALDEGADDYLPKPFDVAELLARARALLRRAQSDMEIPASRIIRFGEYEVNLATRTAITNEGEVLLSEKEAAVLALLARARGSALRRADILEEVWGMDVSPTERTVDNVIVRLRRLFEPDADKPRHITTVRGIGYRFEI